MAPNEPIPTTKVVRFVCSWKMGRSEVDGSVGRTVVVTGTLTAAHLPVEERIIMARKLAHDEVVSTAHANGFTVGPPTLVATEKPHSGDVLVQATALIVSDQEIEPA